MTALTWETLLILALVYFAGCCVGCLARRGYWARHRHEPAGEQAAAVADRLPEGGSVQSPAAGAHIAARSAVMTSPASPAREPFRRADAPAQPQQATTQSGYAAPVPTSAIARFERALTGGGSSPEAPSRLSPDRAPSDDGTVTPAASIRDDDLTRIMAIDAEIEKRLRSLGVTSYAAIAQWTAAETTRVSHEFGFKGRIEQENWIEQAQILARGGETRYSLRVARGETAAARAIEDEGEPHPIVATPMAPESIPDRPSVSDRAAFARETAQFTGMPPAQQPHDAPSGGSGAEAAGSTAGDRQEGSGPALVRTNDLTALRSVRSQALRAVDGAVAGPGRAADAEDLKRIRGIGVLIEKRLNAMGVTAYEQIANWTAADIDKVSQTLDFKGRIERENWVEQARILASGGQTEFSRRLDRGRRGEDR